MLPTHPQVAAAGSGPTDPRLRDGVLSLNQAAQALGVSVQALAPLLRKEQVQVHSLAIGGAPVSVIALSDLARLRRALREREEAAKASQAAAESEGDEAPLWMQVRDAQHNKVRLEGAVQSLRNELNQAREKTAEAEARCESLAKELRIAKHSLERLDQWKRDNDGGDLRIQQQREELEHLRARLSSADGTIQRYELELAGREAEKKELESLRAERDQALLGVERLSIQLEQARARVEDLTKDRDFQGERRAELERKVGALRVAAKKGSMAVKKCKALSAELRACKEVERSRERFADRLEAKVAELQHKLGELRPRPAQPPSRPPPGQPAEPPA
jgi:chromosome segregation ATPase